MSHVPWIEIRKGGYIMKTEHVLSFIKKHRVDIIVISSFLLLSLIMLGVTQLTQEEGSVVQVTVDGEVVGEYSLLKNGIYSLNGGTNTLTIQNGEAYMSYSNCPDHVCENTGKIKHVGQTIICLPNRLTITIVGEITDDAVDFVS